jgi:phage/plasmid-associated DNA primase
MSNYVDFEHSRLLPDDKVANNDKVGGVYGIDNDKVDGVGGGMDVGVVVEGMDVGDGMVVEDYDPSIDTPVGDVDFSDFNDTAGDTAGDNNAYAYAMEPEDSVTVEEIVQSKISKNVRMLKQFFQDKNLITEKGSPNTNIISTSEKKTYYLPPALDEEFFTIMEECRKEKRLLHYGERQVTDTVSHSGIMIDIDRFQEGKESTINERCYSTFITGISEIFRKYLDLSPLAVRGEFRYRVFIIKKPKPIISARKIADKTVYKDGFHMLIPEIQIVKGMKKQLLLELKSGGWVKRAFRDMENIEDPDNQLDMCSAANLVQFFGNSKPEHPPYPLDCVYDAIIQVDDGYVEREKLNVADIAAGKGPGGMAINLTYEMALSFYMEKLNGLPTWLVKRSIEVKPEYSFGKVVEYEQTDDILDADDSLDLLTMSNAESKYLKCILGILDISYATEYEKWFKVICAIAHTNTTYKPLAIWFSERSPEKMSMVGLDKVWSDALKRTDSTLTKRSIMFWARESSPAKFREIEKENYAEQLAKYVYQNEGRVEHSMVAKIVHAMCSEKFVVDVGYNERTARTGYMWLEYVTPGQAMKKGEVWKWRREADPDNIHLFISEHMPKIYAEQVQRIRDRKDNAQSEQIAKYWNNVERTFRMYMSRLSNDGFQHGVVKQAQYRFRSRGFIEELDSYENVMGVGNGVLITAGAPQLLRGFHEYKISKYTDTDYVPYNPDCPIQQKIMQWSRDIFVEPDVNFFMWCHASTGVTSYESACIFLMLIAGGQNGKTSWAKMIHNTLGNSYAAAGKPSLLVNSMERGESANSAQMQMRGKTFFYLDEFTKSSTINDARLKGIVTPGWQSGRDLHEKQSNFKNTCNPMALSNFDFFLDTQDHGTWRRIYYYKNKAKFSKNPDPNNPHEKLADGKWESTYTNDPEYKSAMLALLVHFNQVLWTKYGGDIKNIPVPTIQRETEEYRNKQDTLNAFITQMVVFSPAVEHISLPSIAQHYISWHAMNIKSNKASMEPLAVQADVENSRLSSLFVFDQSGTKILRNHRVRTTPDEPLLEGESFLNSAATKAAAVATPVAATTHAAFNIDIGDNIDNIAPTHMPMPMPMPTPMPTPVTVPIPMPAPLPAAPKYVAPRKQDNTKPYKQKINYVGFEQ